MRLASILLFVIYFDIFLFLCLHRFIFSRPTSPGTSFLILHHYYNSGFHLQYLTVHRHYTFYPSTVFSPLDHHPLFPTVFRSPTTLCHHHRHPLFVLATIFPFYVPDLVPPSFIFRPPDQLSDTSWFPFVGSVLVGGQGWRSHSQSHPSCRVVMVQWFGDVLVLVKSPVVNQRRVS